VTLRYLLDTNTLSEPTRRFPDSRVLAKLREHTGELAIAAPVWHELLFGIERLPSSRKRRILEDYLFQTVRPTIPILPYGKAAAEWQASERARLAAAGRTVPFVDSQIASIAAVHGLVLVTSNHGDFHPFQDLQVVDWKL